MKKILLIIILFSIPFLSFAQNNAGMRNTQQNMSNQLEMRKRMTPEKISIDKWVKRAESRIEKKEKENINLKMELEEFKSELAISEDSKKQKLNKKITKIEEKIEENNQQISNSKMFVYAYKKD